MKKLCFVFAILISLISKAQKTDLGYDFFMVNGQLQYIDLFVNYKLNKITLEKQLTSQLKADSAIKKLEVKDSIITGQLNELNVFLYKADFTITIRSGRYKLVAKNMHIIDTATKKDLLVDPYYTKKSPDDTATDRKNKNTITGMRLGMSAEFYQHFNITESDTW